MPTGSRGEQRPRDAIGCAAAVLYAFGGGLHMIYLAFRLGGQAVRDLRETFLIVLPIASAAITFWFTSKDQ